MSMMPIQTLLENSSITQNYLNNHIMTAAFDDIRPYRDKKEIKEAIQRIIDDKTFYGFAQQMFAGKTLDEKFKELPNVETTEDFQNKIIKPLIKKLIKQTSDGFTVTGLDNLEKGKCYLFISNHRDIIMDSALLCYGLMNNGFGTTEIAIGSNLLARPWITDLVKLNKSFIVRRGDVGIKEHLSNAKHLSAYIHETITKRGESVWLAQREGRTKDGHDETQLSLLKMLNLEGEGDVRENFKNLNIVPVSMSYEYEPCDGLKTHELFMKSTPQGYVKTEQDDLISMFIGLKQQKGRIHFAIGEPICSEIIEEFNEEWTETEVLEKVARIIDKHIVTNYRLFPDNYIALDMLNGSKKYKEYYTKEEKELFIKHMERKLENVNGTSASHRELFLKIYANPVLHKQNYQI